MQKNAKYLVGGLVVVVAVAAIAFGSGGFLQGSMYKGNRGSSAVNVGVSVSVASESPSGNRVQKDIDAPIAIFKVCSNTATNTVGAINLWLQSSSTSINSYAYKGGNYMELYTDNDAGTDNVGIAGEFKINAAVPSTIDATFPLSKPLIINKGECKNVKVATNTYFGLINKANYTDDLFVTVKQLYSDKDATQKIKMTEVSSIKLNY